MASMFRADFEEITMLDAGAGVGSLTAAFVGEICSREHVSVVTSLPPDDGVPIKDLADRLSIFSGPNWSIFLMASPTLWKEADAQVVVEVVRSRTSG